MSTATVAAVRAQDHRPVSPTRSPARATLHPHQSALWIWGLLVALIARELESGTAKPARPQSVTPARRLAAGFAVPAALIVSGTVLLTLLSRLVWWRDEGLRHAPATRDRFGFSTFVGNGTLATAYALFALFALAVGVLAGLLLRRPLPALAAGSLATAAAIGTLRTQRHGLWPVETVVVRTSDPAPDRTGELVDRGLLTTSGDRLSGVGRADVSCDPTDVVGVYADFHPSSRFWPLRLVETGIVLAVTALLVLAAFRLPRRRTGGAV